MDKQEKATLRVGDIVFSNPAVGFGCLVGTIIDIMPIGSPEHDTGHDTDDIYVDFSAPDGLKYSEYRKEEIAQEFSRLYGKRMEFDELPLDGVIMAPEWLARLDGRESWGMQQLLKSRSDAVSYYSEYLSKEADALREQLSGRVTANYIEYLSSLKGFGRRELIEMASKISAMSDAHSYLTTWHNFSKRESEFLLRFLNPLEIVAEEWRLRNSDISEMGYTMDYISEQKDFMLTQHPLVGDAAQSKPEQTRQPKAQAKTNKPTAKKQSIASRLAAAGVEADAYNAQRAQRGKNTTKKQKKEIE